MLPAKLPQLLINGCTGIAVGMATNIPPHNLGEVCEAAVALHRRPEARDEGPAQVHQGPRLPDRRADHQHARRSCARSTRRGRAACACAASGRPSGRQAAAATTSSITSIPYALTKATLVERIADVIINKKLPMLVDVRDESTDDVRIVLELKAGADPDAGDGVPLQAHAARDRLPRQPDLPRPDGEHARSPRPLRVNLAAMLREFLDFREDGRAGGSSSSSPSSSAASTSSRASRSSSTRSTRPSGSSASPTARPTPPRRSSKRFELSDEQTDAILELKLYKLARLEIDAHPRGAEREARPRQGDPGDPRRQAQALEGRSAPRSPRSPGRSRTSGAPRSAARAARRRRVRRRGLHRRRGRDRHPLARRLAQARARGQGPLGDAPARGRRRPGGRARLDQGADGDLLEPRQLPTSSASTTCRPRPATASRCRSSSTFATASGSSARCSVSEKARPRATLALGVTQARLRHALRLRRRTASCRRAPAAASPSRPRATRSSASRWPGDKDVVCVVTSDARALLCKVERDPRARQPRPRRHRHQDRRRRAGGRLRRRRARRTRT